MRTRSTPEYLQLGQKNAKTITMIHENKSSPIRRTGTIGN
jgi:hypothetical protein